MSLRAHWVVLLVALALALPLRTRAGQQNKVEPGELYGVAALFADGESYLHARRVACAMEGAGVTGSDAMLGFPDAAEIVAPPMFDVARTTLVELRSDGHEELARQRFLGELGPWLGALGCFLAWLAARAAGAGAWESVLAAAFVAVAPACVQNSAWGTLADSAFTLIALALCMRFTARTLRAEEPLPAILGGMSSGVFSGLLLASSPAGLVAFLAGSAAFVHWAFTTKSEFARFAARAGLLHALVAALIARMVVLDGPWQLMPGGAMAAWVEFASVLAFASAAPFLVAMLREHASAKRIFPTLVFSAAGVTILLMLGKTSEPLARAWHAWTQARELRGLFESTGIVSTLIALTPVVLFLPVAWMLLWQKLREPPSLYLLSLSVGGVLAVAIDSSYAPMCVLITAIVLACAATAVATSSTKRWVVGGVLAALAAHALAGMFAQPDLALRETKLEIARGLLWMREHTPSPGPWNAPRSDMDYGVLAVPARGEEIAWFARRPAVVSRTGTHGDFRSLREVWNVLNRRDWESMARAMHACGARYIVLSPLDQDQFLAMDLLPEQLTGDLGPVAGYPKPFYDLILAKSDTGSILKRVYASERIVDGAGHATEGAGAKGPAISIWELPPASREDSGPQMLPR